MLKNPLATPCKHVAGSNPESDSLGLRGSPKLAFLARFPVTLVVGLLRHALNVTELWKYQSIFKQWPPAFLVLEGPVSWEAVFTLSGRGGQLQDESRLLRLLCSWYSVFAAAPQH